MAIDYEAEIDALEKKIASGVRSVRHGDTSTELEGFDKLLARLRWLQAQLESASDRPSASYASFDRGDC